MSRNTHHRQRDHFGTDLDTNIVTNGDIGTVPSGTVLHNALGTAIGSVVGLNFVVDGGSVTPTLGVKGFVEVPFNATITACRVFADQTGSLVLDIWKDNYVNFPPTVADSICGGTKPTLSGASKWQYTSMVGWTTTVTAGDVFAFNLDSLSTIARFTVSLSLQRR